jgi:uncharacterized iron-regulated membrane protein
MVASFFPLSRLSWRQVHLWIALGAGVLVVPIGLTGAALVVSDSLDRWIDPALYAVTGTEPTRDVGANVGEARAAVPGAGVVRVRLPAAPGGPVMVLLRGGGEASSGDVLRSVALDPPTGRVLGVRDFRATFVGLVHSFHANLLLPAFNGRSIVGWAGVGLLILALSGLYLWWPRTGSFVHGLGWRRGVVTSVGLHHMFGVWMCVPLAVMASTGVSVLPEAVPGDAFAASLRRLHEGDHRGWAWRVIVFLAGLAPAILLATGLVMWLRRGKPIAAKRFRLHETVAFPAGKEHDAAAKKYSVPPRGLS